MAHPRCQRPPRLRHRLVMAANAGHAAWCALNLGLAAAVLLVAAAPPALAGEVLNPSSLPGAVPLAANSTPIWPDMVDNTTIAAMFERVALQHSESTRVFIYTTFQAYPEKDPPTSELWNEAQSIRLFGQPGPATQLDPSPPCCPLSITISFYFSYGR